MKISEIENAKYVLIDEIILKEGYDPRIYFKGISRKYLWVVCPNCNLTRRIKFTTYKFDGSWCVKCTGAKGRASYFKTRPSLERRFWNAVIKNGDDECWDWKLHKDELGYGRMGNGQGKYMLAHRISMIVHGHEVPDDLCVLHKCDNPSCTNPKHLFIGTKHENNTDMANKMRSPIGDKNGQAKLTFDQVKEIREMISKENRLAYSKIANKFGVSTATIHAIAKGHRWQRTLEPNYHYDQKTKRKED